MGKQSNMKNEIILVPFPFDDLTNKKVRPALCLTNEISEHRHIIIAFITSQAHKANEESDILIPDDDNDFHQTGLRTTSAIRLHRIVTIPSSLALRHLGHLPDSFNETVTEKLIKLFDLFPYQSNGID